MGAVGIIGGSGIYDLPGLTVKEEIDVVTPFGKPSGPLLKGVLHDRTVMFMARHGNAHSISPSNINYRANIYAFKMHGVTDIVSVSAVGSLKEELKPTDFVLPDQFIDRTKGVRKDTFFDGDMVVHISMSDPVCCYLREKFASVIKEMGIAVHPKGVYVNMEGPAFSTRAESNLYRSWGGDIIGMTNLTEAKLAREAQICYMTLASVTDYDCWLEQNVNVEMILENLKVSVARSKEILSGAISVIDGDRECSCRSALKQSVITPAAHVSAQTKERLKYILED